MRLLQLLRQRGLRCMWYKFRRTYITPDRDMCEIGARNGTYDYLLRYASACNADMSSMQAADKTIWVCWLQGFDTAPALVRKCLANIRQYSGDYQVVELTEDNLSQYVTLPEHIWDKYRRGIISRTHFSDALRFALLAERGGLWIDSTVLLTGALPDYITHTDLFAYHSDQKGSSLLSVNLISCCRHHPLVVDTYNMILRYWQCENRTVDYNMTAVFWTIATRANEHNARLWKDVLFVPTALKDILFNELNSPYSPDRWQQICALSPVHKLTYKFSELGIDTTTKGTFYDVLINKDTANV